MAYVLIYDKGYPFEDMTKVEEFESLDQMTDFINKEKSGLRKEETFEVRAAYEVRRKIEYEPVEIVTKLKPKE